MGKCCTKIFESWSYTQVYISPNEQTLPTFAFEAFSPRSSPVQLSDPDQTCISDGLITLRLNYTQLGVEIYTQNPQLCSNCTL